MNNYALKIIKQETYKLKRCVNFYDKFMKDIIYKDLHSGETESKGE